MGQDGGEGLAEESIADLILPGKAEGGSGSDGRDFPEQGGRRREIPPWESNVSSTN